MSRLGHIVAGLSRAFQLLTGLLGVVLVGAALVVLGFAVGEGEQLTDVGWLAVVACPIFGALALWRAAVWNRPVCCRRCGAVLARGDVVCAQCGLNSETSVWAAIGKMSRS
jgi:hypothetical protein